MTSDIDVDQLQRAIDFYEGLPDGQYDQFIVPILKASIADGLDARRYRWLREHDVHNYFGTGSVLDSGIDSELAKQA